MSGPLGRLKGGAREEREAPSCPNCRLRQSDYAAAVPNQGAAIVLDWHCSDRHLNGGSAGTSGLAGRPDKFSRLSSATRPPGPAWKRIVTGQSFAWRYRRARNRIRARRRRLTRAALRRLRTSPTLRRGHQHNSLLKRAHSFVTRRQRARFIAPELRVPVEVQAITVDRMQRPALDLGPFAIATRTSSDMVRIEVAAGAELVIASGSTAVVPP